MIKLLFLEPSSGAGGYEYRAAAIHAGTHPDRCDQTTNSEEVVGSDAKDAAKH